MNNKLSPWEVAADYIGMKLGRLEVRVICFFKGHMHCWGDRLSGEPDYCARCSRDWPQDDTCTLADLLNNVYTWLFERDWAWFNRLDSYLYKHHRDKLPSWRKF